MKLNAEQVIEIIESILTDIIEAHIGSKSEEDFLVWAEYGPGKYYMNWITGAYNMGLHSLIHHILYEEKIYEKILNEKQFADMMNVIAKTPEAIYGPSEETDDDFEVQELLDAVYYKLIRFVGLKLQHVGYDIGNSFEDYL